MDAEKEFYTIGEIAKEINRSRSLVNQRFFERGLKEGEDYYWDIVDNKRTRCILESGREKIIQGRKKQT